MNPRNPTGRNQWTNGKGKSSEPPKGKADSDPSRQSSAPPPPGTSQSFDPKAEAKKLKGVKMTPQLANDLGRQMAMAEAIGFRAWARMADDDRINISAEEGEILSNVWSTFIMVYADEIGGWLPIIMLAGTQAALIGGRLMLGPKEGEEAQSKATKDAEKKVKADVVKGARVA